MTRSGVGREVVPEDEGIVTILRDPGPTTSRRFLEAWYGPPRLDPQPLPEGRSPLAVRELASIVARWPRAFHQNHLEVDGPLIDGRFRQFYLENQSTYEWAVEETDPDGLVWGRDCYEEDWHPERETLARFLVQAVVFEAILGTGWGDEGHHERRPGYLATRFVPDPTARFIGGANVPVGSASHADAMLEGLEPIPYGAWRWPSDPTAFLASHDAIGYRCPNGDGFNVFIASRRPEALSHIAQIPGLEVNLLIEMDEDVVLEQGEAVLRQVLADATRPDPVTGELPQDPGSQIARLLLGP